MDGHNTHIDDKKTDKFGDLAKAVVADLAKQERYPLYTGGRFYLWQGTKYTPCDELDMLVREFFKANKLGQSNNVIGNVAPIVKSIAFKDASKFGQMPFWVGGAQPFADVDDVIAFNNGLFDLQTGTITRHSPKWCSTVCLPFDYDPLADCPRWLAFLDEVFEGDAHRADLLGEWMGYCMTWDISQQKALLMYGPPRSGKGTTLGVIERLVGDHFTGYSLDRLVSSFGLSDLRNKLVAGVGELELNGNKEKTRIVERFKSITGGDRVSVEEKYNPLAASERIYARFVIATNSMPNLKDASGAMLSRLLVLPFQRSFLGKEDTALIDKLTEELPGIANWAMTGLKRLRAAGQFTTSKISTEAQREFGIVSAPVREFVLARLVVAPTLNPGWLPPANTHEDATFLPTEGIYTEYKDWCDEIGESPADERYVMRDLRSLLPKLKMKQRRIGGSRQRGYEGLGYLQTAM